MAFLELDRETAAWLNDLVGEFVKHGPPWPQPPSWPLDREGRGVVVTVTVTVGGGVASAEREGVMELVGRAVRLRVAAALLERVAAALLERVRDGVGGLLADRDADAVEAEERLPVSDEEGELDAVGAGVPVGDEEGVPVGPVLRVGAGVPVGDGEGVPVGLALGDAPSERVARGVAVARGEYTKPRAATSMLAAVLSADDMGPAP